MPFKKNIFLHIFVVLLIAGFGGRSEETQESLFTDLPEYNLEEVQVFTSGDYRILGRPVYSEIDSDGNHLMMDLARYEIQVFDAGGIDHTSFGSQGEGPGEMRQPMRPVISEHDTLYISDNARRSLIVYSRNGDFNWKNAYNISYPATEEGAPVILKYRISMENAP